MHFATAFCIHLLLTASHKSQDVDFQDDGPVAWRKEKLDAEDLDGWTQMKKGPCYYQYRNWPLET